MSWSPRVREGTSRRCWVSGCPAGLPEPRGVVRSFGRFGAENGTLEQGRGIWGQERRLPTAVAGPGQPLEPLGLVPPPPRTLRFPPFSSHSPQATLSPPPPRLFHIHSLPRMLRSSHFPPPAVQPPSVSMKTPKRACWSSSPSHQRLRALHLQLETSVFCATLS